MLTVLYNNKSYKCINNINYTNHTNNTILYFYNLTNQISDNINEESDNITLYDDMNSNNIDIASNASKIDCDNSELTLREILIILGFSIVIICFIIYNIVDFFELTKRDCLCYEKEKKIHEMDRSFEDIIEMIPFDEDGNFIFGKRHKAVQTDNCIESKGFDI